MRKDIPPSGEAREAPGAAAELARIQLGKWGEGFCRKGKIRTARERQTDGGRGEQRGNFVEKSLRRQRDRVAGNGTWKV